MNINLKDTKNVILKTKGKYCTEDIKITLDESIKQPKGNLEITVNGIEDVSDYATVTINVPTNSNGDLKEISDPTIIETLLTESNIGKMYRYTGETNDKFVNGAIYQITQED